MKWVNNSLPLKLALTAVMALLLLIPLAMVKNQILDRQDAFSQSKREVAAGWGLEQTLTGPVLQIDYSEPAKNASGETVMGKKSANIYPQTLKYEIETTTQELHRSIYDITVYGADVVVTGDFVIPAHYGQKEITGESVCVGLSDLRCIDGEVLFHLADEKYSLREGTDAKNPQGHPRLMEPVQLEPAAMDGKTALPFRLTYRVRGSSSLMVKPYGEITEVRMHSNCPDPSFTGDFLPSEREVGEEGFTARWTVSKINRGAPDDTSFGVNLLSGVTLSCACT